MTNAKPLDRLMAEVIEMPGFPQLHVTRGWLYQFLKRNGWPEAERGYGSLDYCVFARKGIDGELTPLEERDYWLGLPDIDEIYRRDGNDPSH